jgi:hypothetical protein
MRAFCAKPTDGLVRERIKEGASRATLDVADGCNGIWSAAHL